MDCGSSLGAGLLARELARTAADWPRFVALTYPLLATPPGVDDLVTAAAVIGKHKDLPVLRPELDSSVEELAGPVAEFVSAGGAALDIIDVPKPDQGSACSPHRRARAAVTKALDWAIAHLGEEPGADGKLLVRPRAKKRPLPPAVRRRSQSGRRGQEPVSPAEPATGPPAAPAPITPAPVAPAAAQPPLAGLGTATVAAVTADTPAARVIGREHSAYDAHDLEAFLAMYSPTARILLVDDTELKGLRFLREYYRRASRPAVTDGGGPAADAGGVVVEHVVTYDDGGSTPQLSLYRVADGLITDVEFRV